MRKRLIMFLVWIMTISSATVCLATGITVGDPTGIPGLEGKVSVILGMIQWVGFVVAIGMVIYVGIKYVTAGAGGKADVKSTMVPWLAGAALIALAAPIANGIFQILK